MKFPYNFVAVILPATLMVVLSKTNYVVEMTIYLVISFFIYLDFMAEKKDDGLSKALTKWTVGYLIIACMFSGSFIGEINSMLLIVLVLTVFFLYVLLKDPFEKKFPGQYLAILGKVYPILAKIETTFFIRTSISGGH